ncbi:MAG: C39 family peptidase [Clostridia bacterium]|nr:C39 family peptidase [Clostridia bacterium]
MKKSIALILTAALLFALTTCMLTGCSKLPEKHLILDADGNYGGTLDAARYGEGAPLNGMYDQKNSQYFTAPDYYNMPSTATRTIFPNFAPYQQTMKDSSGVACALMLLNYFGEDVKNTYNELALVNKYEQLNQATVYGNGTTADGLVNLFTDLGYEAVSEEYVEYSAATDDKITDFNMWLEMYINDGNFVLVRYRDDVNVGWHVIIGYDNMGTPSIPKDDVIIFADPWDGWDHYQDGYTTSGSGRFYRWWFDSIEYTDDGTKITPSQTRAFENVIVTPKTPITFERVETDTMPTQKVPEHHMLLNADGSYGGTTNGLLYGSIKEKNGSSDHLDKTYYKFVDYYNMKSTSSRVMLTNYRAYQQTMASSCGIAATMSVLNYYGHDIVGTYNEIALVDKYHELNTNEPNIKGVGTTRFGLQKMLQHYGFDATITPYEKEGDIYFDTYQAFVAWAKDGLSKGMPLTICFKPHSGHWEVIIGYDDMGTPYVYDDVVVLADPHDTFDHYQDGYNTLSAMTFYSQWYNGNYKWPQKFVIYPNK